MAAIPIRWSKPSMGWLKLNIDGASLSNPRRAGGGRPRQGQLGQLGQGLLKIHWACHEYYSGILSTQGWANPSFLARHPKY